MTKMLYDWRRTIGLYDRIWVCMIGINGTFQSNYDSGCIPFSSEEVQHFDVVCGCLVALASSVLYCMQRLGAEIVAPST